MEDAVLLKVSPQGIATICLNRGELHNALDDRMVELLTPPCRPWPRMTASVSWY